MPSDNVEAPPCSADPLHARDERGTVRGRLIDAATRLLRLGGARRAAIDDIAAAAGLSKPTLYRHFASKDDLVIACLLEEGRQMGRELAQVVDLAGEAPAERLRAIGRYYATWFSAPPQRGLLALNLAVDYPRAEGPVGRAIQAEINALQQRLSEAIDPRPEASAHPACGPLSLAVFGASAACQAIGVSACEDLTASIEALIATLPEPAWPPA